jgi:diguanylate cyclase (GGDEF)-like protein
MRLSTENIKGNIHKSTLELIYLLLMGFSGVTFITNLINNRPFNVYGISLASALICLILYYLSSKKGKAYEAKIFFLVTFNVLYVPYAWITSPGSTSAMPLFSLFIIMITITFVEKKWEIIFPIITICESLYLFYFEMVNPDYFEKFLNYKVRLQDVSLNFLILSVAIILIVYRINRFYLKQHSLVYIKSVTDQLTNVYNRRYLMKVLLDKKSNLLNYFSHYTVVMVDINNFKAVNDVYGHLIGDEVLKALGELLNDSCRKYDICGRYGGDEFMVILPDTEIAEALNFCKRIEEKFFLISKKYPKVDFSLAHGIANSKEKTVKEIINLADEQLYNGKRSS